jgi:hypothetical protein
VDEIQDPQAFLDSLIERVSDWDKNLVEQAVFAFGSCNPTLSANDFRDLLPTMAHGHIGIVISNMAKRRLTRRARDRNGYPLEVKSTAESTHGKPIAVWELTEAGFEAARSLLVEREAAA